QVKENSALKEGSKGSSSDHIAAHTFTFRELAAATKNFRADCFVGEGGFGQVYRGHLESSNHGATPMDQTSIPEGCEQIFMISETTSNTRKEDLAWATTYILLRNTNSISVNPISTKPNVLDWFEKQIKSIGLSNLKETLYLPQIEDSGLWEMLPKGTRSLLVQPVLQVLHPNDSGNEQIQGFVLLASSMRYAYSDKDRAWAGALANKFRGK
ncbi:hypothetical protein ABKV19_016803, partial [Rosa sericea]